jgi:hypothetical protein
MYSHPDESLRPGPGDRRGPEQSRENGRQVEAAVEPVLDFGKIAIGILGEIERMVGAGVGGFQVAQEGHRQTLLKLHLVDPHRASPVIECAHYSPRRAHSVSLLNFVANQ